MLFKHFTNLALLATTALAQPQGDLDLTQILKQIGELSTLYKAIEAVPGLATKLDKGNITVLAPSNKAFENLIPGTPEYVAAQGKNIKDLESLLAYHVVEGLIFYAAAARDGPVVTTTPAFRKTLLTNQDKFNGMAATEVSGGQNVDLVYTPGPKGVGLVIGGELQTSNVTAADLEGKDVLIHFIDEVLTLPRTPSVTAENLGLTAIVGALEATKLVDTIDSAKDLTIFIPSNKAFEAIGNILAGASVKTLKEVLEYHVVSGSVVFSTEVKNEKVKSLGGEELTLTVKDHTVFVDTAKVIIPNIITSNGVVHVIDEVLNPESTSVNRAKLAPGNPATPNFSGAKSVTYVPFASSAPSASTTLSVPSIAASSPPFAGAKAASASEHNKAMSKNAAVGMSVSTGKIVAALGACVAAVLML